jgi:hypothetical protein
MARLAGELVQALASLPRTAARELTESAARALFGPRFDVVCERAGDPDATAALRQLEAETIAGATGLRVPLVTCHRDLRPKHVIADAEGAGALMGIVDWSCLQLEGPPLYDLFHFIAQERTAQAGWTARSVWLALQDRDALTPGEAQAVRAYEAALDLPPAWYAVIARAYPVLFGAMAEEHWDFSRPLWIKRMFGIG